MWIGGSLLPAKCDCCGFVDDNVDDPKQYVWDIGVNKKMEFSLCKDCFKNLYSMMKDMVEVVCNDS